ncbi:ABC transporter ATP-binding protein [Gordonia sp. VNK21]|uniref:ABC transporter ATP-binding protein n=1 Tax=Gordonia sp. VNK21 TaxID=3382483 RepID=UPI0038D4EB16
MRSPRLRRSVPDAAHPTTAPTRLSGQNLTLGYDKRVISENLNLDVPDGRVTAIIGPNACGKSTLLRALSRLLRPSTGTVLLDGAEINTLPAKEVARRLGLLPQTSIAPDGIRVADLVARGRFPHQHLIQQWTPEDERAVVDAMTATRTDELSGRLVDELSGGQRQRVWIAMVLAQQTDLVLFDEPTTYLDITHQVELLDLFTRLNRELGRTVVVVLHELNQAFRYADHVVVMKDGSIVAQGAPAEIVTPELIEQVYRLPCRIIGDPESHTPLVIPKV